LNLARYYHTLRFLKASQFVWRARFALLRPSPDKSPAPLLRARACAFPLPVLRESNLVDANTFRFLGTTRALRDAGDWNNSQASRLWLYNLHYFNDLNTTQREQRSGLHENLIARWIAENTPGSGVGWEPYPLSLRIVNWIKWACSGFALSDAAAQSVAVQVRYLRKRLEHHLLGNHLLANSKALIFAGLFFQGREADGWRACGLSLLDAQLPEQILEDGGHFERSTMYHCIALQDLLDLVALTRVFPLVLSDEVGDRWTTLVRRMVAWLAKMCHPDGEISFFNDAAFGVALAPAQLRASAGALGIASDGMAPSGLSRLDASGYVRLNLDPISIVFDAAPVGPDYQPGHAHADTLSFELSWNGQRVITNSGTSTYDVGSQRARERSTAAHNTVEVDGEDSSEVWGAFRVARRARPDALRTGPIPGGFRAACSHDGYRRLTGSPEHRREIDVRMASVRINDVVSGRGLHRLAGYFHLHPNVRLHEMSSGDWQIQFGEGIRLCVRGEDGLRLTREQSDYASEFGALTPRSVLVWRIEQKLPASATVTIVEDR